MEEIISAVKAKATEGMAFPVPESGDDEIDNGDLLEKAELEIEEGVLNIKIDEEEK